MTPEQEARQDIDRQLRQCGWAVQVKCAPGIGSLALSV